VVKWETVVSGEQFYVTHCGTADSVLGAPGYSVRAATVTDEEQDALLLALAYRLSEFCDAFIPPEVLLDDAVLLDGKRVPRSEVEVKYFPASGGGSKRAKLTADPDKTALNEFTVAERYPGEDTLVLLGATEYYPKQLKPTEQSRAAVLFAEARRALASAPGAPRWTPKTIDELKNTCKPLSKEVNQLKVPGGKPDTSPEIWTRLESLAKGAEACRQLFEKGR
jgi:hypothetical protein